MIALEECTHSGLQWLLGITCGDQFPLVTCEDYTNETFLFKSSIKQNIFISKILEVLNDQWKFLPWWLLSKSEYNATFV